MSSFLELLDQRVLVFDGATGTMLQRADLPLSDYQGLENCSEILNLTRPDVVAGIHDAYLEAGADCVETNSFGGTHIVLAEFGLEDQTYEINKRAAELARAACDRWSTADKPRFAVGSMGPGTKLPSLGHIGWDELFDAYREQAIGLLDGGVDVLLVETCQDILQTKCALAAIASVQAERPTRVAVMAQVTMETTGTMLVGTEIGAALALLDALPCDVVGLNCATGPHEMAGHVAYLGRHSRKPVSILPNAGLPQLIDGETVYPLGPGELAEWHERFVREDGVAIVGGCCGTGPEHIKAVAERLAGVPRVVREPEWEPQIASLYSPVTLRQELDVLAIGERANANGSRRFRKLLYDQDWDGIVKMGRRQAKGGSHALDVCVAVVDRPEVPDMDTVVLRYNTQVSVPLVVDTTEVPVLEAALKRIGGRPVINSINLEDGEARLDHVCQLARQHGAAVIALTIDEEGMAKTAARKLAIARRLFDLAVHRHGLRPEDILFDPLTFTVATGNEGDRKLAVETLDGIRAIAAAFPECGILLGVSNVSFGLAPHARHVLNSVMLHHAREAGLTAAIVHASKIVPLYRITEEKRQVAEDLIFDRRSEGYDPLPRYLELFADASSTARAARPPAATIEERLKERIIDGDRVGLEADLDEALQTHPPLQIINELLLDGMRVVGELFGAGQMQLPFVLQSAETMKAAVAHLEPHMDKIEGQERASIVLATVRGDVHDIGKNLVDIILTNNGYKVHNIGIKQPIDAILRAWRESGADAIGMSGLLVKSTVVMKENLAIMRAQGIDVPVVLGGAALTKRFVVEDCSEAYGGKVLYARDAFAGLAFMDDVAKRKARGELPIRTPQEPVEHVCEACAPRPPSPPVVTPPAEHSEAEAREELARARISARPLPDKPIAPTPLERADVPAPPFYGTRVLDHVPVEQLVPYLNRRTLFRFQWGYRQRKMPDDLYDALTREVILPVFERVVRTVSEEQILRPKGVYGFFPAHADGEELIVYEPEGDGILTRLHFARQRRPPHRSIADYFRKVGEERDVVALTAVTMGPRASEVEKEWLAADRYRDYLYLHGLSVEMAEAFAEYLHARIRREWGIGHHDDREIRNLLKLKFRGCRYSFGYPACPDLDENRKLLRLLGSERVGLRMHADGQMHPEQSTSAVVVHHPQAGYFQV